MGRISIMIQSNLIDIKIETNNFEFDSKYTCSKCKITYDIIIPPNTVNTGIYLKTICDKCNHHNLTQFYK
jgi:hypothetical protein